MTNMIRVRAMEPFTNKVLLSEVDADHPGGIGFLYASKTRVFDVAETGAVNELLRAKRIEIVKGDASASTAATETSGNSANVSDVTNPDSGVPGATGDVQDIDVFKMKRDELNALAEQLELDPTAYKTIDEIREAIADQMGKE